MAEHTISKLAEDLDHVDLAHVNDLVMKFGLYGAARILGYDVSHYNNLLMAGRLAIEDLKNNSPKTLLEYAGVMRHRLNVKTYDFIVNNHVVLQEAIDLNAHFDYDNDWFSANTMITMYSAKIKYGANGIETPQHTWMRIAIQLYHDGKNAIENVIQAYEEMAVGWYTPASPTIFNAGMKKPQMASCFAAGTKVITKHGVVPIEQIKIGDTVITHKGNLRKVTQLHKNPLNDRKLYDLRVFATSPIRVTENHRFWVADGKAEPHWVPVSELTTNHFIAVSKITDTNYADDSELNLLSPGAIEFIAAEIKVDDDTHLADLYTWDSDYVSLLMKFLIEKHQVKKIGPKCAATVYYVSRKFGILYFTPNGDNCSHQLNNNGVSFNKMVFLRVASLKQINETPEFVYTLGVEEDHSYCVEGIIAENCFLLTIDDDLESILKTGVYRGGMISKTCGAMGFDISRVRHSEIDGIGMSHGIIPMLQLYNDMVRYVDQGGDKRKGAATIFLRPHHYDVEDFIQLPRKVGDRYQRTHDLNICLWTPWIFWERIRDDGIWSMFCPAKTSQLNDIYGLEFSKAYIAAEKDPSLNKYKRTIRARELYDKILEIQKETGMPYIMNSDSANIKSNHRHLGYIRSSNLCLEIVEYTDNNSIAVCNLHSLSLRMYGKGPFDKTNPNIPEAILRAVDFPQLCHIARRVVENLNRVIDHNWYPLDTIKSGETKAGIVHRNNKKHRPIGMGVSGFAELLYILDLAFEDPVIVILNKMIFAAMYWNALAVSVQLAIKDGSYSSFVGSPTSHGLLQFDLWKEEFNILGPNSARKAEDDEPIDPSLWDQKQYILFDVSMTSVQDVILPTWQDMKRCIMKYGLRNSLFLALMPTASTAQIRRNCESVEAHQNNLYSRKVLTCSYPVLNRYLVKDLEDLGAWNEDTGKYLQANNGSVLGLTKYVAGNSQLFPLFNGNASRLSFLELKYKTMWELPQKLFLKLAADRGRYIDQSQSTNVYMKECSSEKLKACHLYSNMLGLKTNMYYLRQSGADTIKFTADPTMLQYIKGVIAEAPKESSKESSKETQKELAKELAKEKVVVEKSVPEKSATQILLEYETEHADEAIELTEEEIKKKKNSKINCISCD